MPIIMKKVLATLFAVALGLNLSAQTDYVETWDPDADGDGLIGVSDLLALLGVFQEEDMDNDGIWDSVDDCVGAYDECEVCNGPGPQILGIDTIIVYYDSLYAEAIDEWWVYELYSDTLLTYFCENPGCMDPTADNYDPYAIEEDNTCVWAEGSPVCDFQNSFTFDGYSYDLVAIGSQCWFKENLRSEVYANGDSIPYLTNEDEWISTFSGAQVVYADGNFSPSDGSSDVESNLENYGRLYNGHSVIDERGVCPSDFHVPSELDVSVLFDFVGSPLGEQLRSSPSDSPAWSGTNESGFSALPGGYRGSNWGFFGNAAGSSTEIWVALFYTNDALHAIELNWVQDPNVNNRNLNHGSSIRCIKDTE